MANLNVLNISELAQSCEKQAELAYTRWNDRRVYEWKLNIGFWTLIAATVAFYSRAPRGAPNVILAIAIALAGFLIYAKWLYGLWGSNAYDIELESHYRRQAQALIGGALNVEPFPHPEIMHAV